MGSASELLTAREIASAFWLVVIGVALVAVPRFRPAMGGVVRAFGNLLTPGVAVMIAVYFAWLTFGVWVASHVPAWNERLLIEAILWAAIQGAALLGSLGDVGKPGFVGRHLRRTVGLSVLLTAYLNMITFPLLVEIAIQPIGALLAMMAIASRGTENESWTGRLAALFGLAFIAATALNLVVNFGRLELTSIAVSVLLPIWLTVMAISALYMLSVVDQYLVLFRLADRDARAGGWRSRLRARLALLFGFKLNAYELAQARPDLGTVRRVVLAPDLTSALAEIEDNRAGRRAKAAMERQKAADLVALAGVQGTDDDGRQLDRREFAETIDALEDLATRHMGWYRNRGGRYRHEVLGLMVGSRALNGLTSEHGITVRIRRDGQAWFAWRRTISGWVFGIGADGPPPAQWFYEGPTIPKGYPADARAWSRVPSNNWEP